MMLRCNNVYKTTKLDMFNNSKEVISGDIQVLELGSKKDKVSNNPSKQDNASKMDKVNNNAKMK